MSSRRVAVVNPRFHTGNPGNSGAGACDCGHPIDHHLKRCGRCWRHRCTCQAYRNERYKTDAVRTAQERRR